MEVAVDMVGRVDVVFLGGGHADKTHVDVDGFAGIKLEGIG